MKVLGWQQNAAKIGMQRCAASSQWLKERISLSRYAHVMFFFLNENLSTDVYFQSNINLKLIGAGSTGEF